MSHYATLHYPACIPAVNHSGKDQTPRLHSASRLGQLGPSTPNPRPFLTSTTIRRRNYSTRVRDTKNYFPATGTPATDLSLPHHLPLHLAIMPYNTRRKSLSLPSLGIHLPNSSRSSAHRSPPATVPGEQQQQQPPSKKIKRSHISSSTSPTPASPPRTTTIRFRDDRPKSAGRVAENTPPPSPGGESGQIKVDTEGIDDTIVVGVIQQLEKTGNRPHLLKELGAVLANSISIVERCASSAFMHAKGTDVSQLSEPVCDNFITTRNLPPPPLDRAVSLSSR